MSGFTLPGSAEEESGDKIGNQPPSAAATQRRKYTPQSVVIAVSRGTNSNQRHLETE